MDLHEIVKKLEVILKLEADVALIYEYVLQKISGDELNESIRSFRDDHRRHIEILSSIVSTTNGALPEIIEVTDPFIGELKGLKNVNSLKDAFNVLHRVELLTNKEYEEVLSWDIDPKIEEILDENLEDEQLHLAFIVKTISQL